MALPETCFLTDLPAKVSRSTRYNRYVVHSDACGDYEISRPLADDDIDRQHPNTRHVLAAIARQWSEADQRLVIKVDNVEEILDSVVVPNGPLEQIDEIVKYIRKETKYFGADVWIDHRTDYPVAFARNESEFVSLLYEAQEMDYIQMAQIQQRGKYFLNYNCRLAREGYQRIDELRRTGRDSNQAFVAMWFDAQMDEAWKEGIKPALEEDTGWKALHMGALEHNEKIDDRMIAEIRRSGLLVADLTGHRQNVYFEAGFAMGLGIPVIYTCREDEASDEKVQFDTRQYKYISWTEPTDLRQKLRERIEATGLAKTLRENAGEN